MTYQERLTEIIRECTGEFAAQYRFRNQAKEPYSIKLAENKAEAAITQALAAINALNATTIDDWMQTGGMSAQAATFLRADLRQRFGVDHE